MRVQRRMQRERFVMPEGSTFDELYAARDADNIGERVEAGIVLTGTEVKSLRAGRATLADAFATIDNGEVWLRNANIPEYEFGTFHNHAAKRNRKLLLHLLIRSLLMTCPSSVELIKRAFNAYVVQSKKCV